MMPTQPLEIPDWARTEGELKRRGASAEAISTTRALMARLANAGRELNEIEEMIARHRGVGGNDA